ncbi:chordin-like protein 2 [Protopterus annectens]|uniref:chordin-like protein 2 n=1 Tax=Protopterus annectens TaxID=7888 RepID=UPI001CF9AB9A|nr:chordin-like protein 2 [Protopterus annectens]
MVLDTGGIFFCLGIFLLFNTPDTTARTRTRSDMFCTFQNKRYSPGQSWHPYLEPHGFMYCLQCTCSEMGVVSCYKIRCPALHCSNPVKDQQQCCARCPEPHTPSGLRAPRKPCNYNGTVYQHGGTFTADEPFPSRQQNQCVQCSCFEGHVYCGLKTCPELSCSSPVVVPDSCCEVCKDTEKSLEEEQLQPNKSIKNSQNQCPVVSLSKRLVQASSSAQRATHIGLHPRNFKQKQKGGGTTMKIVLKEKHMKACIYNGRTYSHGEFWHPVVRSIGTLPCILCTCKDGSQDCKRVVCPSEYPCNLPEKVEGKCCKVCQETEVKPIEENIQVKCLNSPRNILIYMYKPPISRLLKENIRIMAVEKDGSEEVEMYIWKMVNGIFRLADVKMLGRQQFQQQEQNFRLMSRTDEGLWKFFRSPEEKMVLTESEENEVKEL